MKNVALLGQSLFAEMTTYDDGTIPTPAGHTMLDLSHSTPSPVYGNGAKRLALTLAWMMSDSVLLINGGWGGSALLSGNANPSYPWLYWANISAPSPLTTFFAMCDNNGVVPDVLVWNQGQQDYHNVGGYPDLRGSYYSTLALVYSLILAHFNRTPAQMPLIVCVSGKNGGAADAGSQHVIAAQIQYATSGAPGVSLGVSQYDLPTRDGTHYTFYGYEMLGCQVAGSIAHVLGRPGSMPGAGPVIIGGTRYGSTIMLDLNLWGSHLCWTTGLTGFQLWAQDWSFQPTCYADVYYDQIRLQMSWVGGTWVTYQYQASQDGSVPVRDVYDASGCGRGYSVTPLPYPILC